MADFKSHIVSDALKNAGKILIDKAEEIGNDLSKNKGLDLNIWIRCDTEETPTIEIQSTYTLL